MLLKSSDYLNLVFRFSDEVNDEIKKLDDNSIKTYHSFANNLISKIGDVLQFTDFFGEFQRSEIGPRSYTEKFAYGYDGPLIAYHYNRADMGVIMQMSGSVLHDYRAKYYDKHGEDIEVNIILQNLKEALKDKPVNFRISRLDVAIDFIDELDVDITSLYNDLTKERVEILTSKNIKNQSKHKAFTSDSLVETIYIGSRQSNNFVRIYDKKRQVIDKAIANQYEQALKSQEWVRFELEIKNQSAHGLTDILLDIKTVEGFHSHIVQLITDRYRFGVRGKNKSVEYNKMTELMISELDNEFPRVSVPRINREYELVKMERYFTEGNSGFQNYIYRKRQLYGEESVKRWFEEVLRYNKEDYKPSEETLRYVKQRRKEQENKG